MPQQQTVPANGLRTGGPGLAGVLRTEDGLKVCSFNVERGYKTDGIIEYLKGLGGLDVVLLQEVDYGCKRTRGRDVVAEIAGALGMDWVWGLEFEELDSPLRSRRKAGGGFHGNAILSRHGFKKYGRMVHEHTGLDWSDPKASGSEPRRGGRCAVWATIGTDRQGDLAFYCVHFENHASVATRLNQFSEIANLAVGIDATKCIVGGDFNTLMHGVLRATHWPSDSDSSRWRFGSSEAEVWERVIRQQDWSGSGVRQPPPEHKAFLASLTDPFDKNASTLDTSTWVYFLRSFFYTAKLDWLMHSPHFCCTSHSIGGPGLSDHLALVCAYTFK